MLLFQENCSTSTSSDMTSTLSSFSQESDLDLLPSSPLACSTQYIESPLENFVASMSSRSLKFYNSFKEPPITNTMENNPVIYPGNIPNPLSLDNMYSKYLLKVSRKEFITSYHTFCMIIRSISGTVMAYLKRVPTTVERRQIAQSLITEYGTLGSGFPAWNGLVSYLRRRFNNQIAEKNRIFKNSMVSGFTED